jgi:hypothetical protein
MKRLYSVFIALVLATPVFGQYNLAIATSNYCVMNSMALNPANIAGCREKYSFSLIGFGFGVDNNAGSFNLDGGLVVAVGSGKTNNMFNYANNSRISMLAPYVDIVGPGILVKLDKATTVAFSTRIRGINQFNNFDQTLFHSFNDPYYKASDDINVNLNNFNYTAHVWGDLGLTVGRVVYDDRKNRIKAGGTLRYLGGIAYVAVKGRNMDLRFKKNMDTMYVSNVDLDYLSNFLYTRPGQGNNLSTNIFSLLANGNGASGIGGDLGITYEYNPKKLKNGYLARVSASILEIGAVSYHGENNTQETFSGGGKVTGKGILDNVRNFASIQRYVTTRGFKADITKVKTTLYMPTRLMLSGDYNVNKNYFVNASFVISLRDREAIGNSFYNQFSITPRYETQTFSVGLPITFNTLSNSFKTGIGIAGSGMFIGSDDLLAVFSRSQAGVTFYAGINIPIY